MFESIKNYFQGVPKATKYNTVSVGHGRTIPVDANGDMVFATCIEILAKQMAQIKWGLYGKDNKEIESVMQLMNFALNVQPYPGISAFDFWKYIETQRLSYGNAFAYIKVEADLKYLIPLDAAGFNIYWDTENILEGDRKIIYEYRDSVTKKTFTFLPEEILHFKAFSANGIVGRPAIRVLRDTLNSNAEVESALRSAVSNGFHGTIVLQTVADLSQAKKKELQNQISELMANSNRTILPLPPGMQATNIANDIQQYYELLKTTNAQAISSIFGIPLVMLNIGGGTGMATFSTNQITQFYNLTVAPIIAQYANELTCKLLTRKQANKGYAFDSANDVFDFLDAQAKASVLVSYKANGILTANEARASLLYSASDDEVADRLISATTAGGTLGDNEGKDGGRGNTNEGE